MKLKYTSIDVTLKDAVQSLLDKNLVKLWVQLIINNY